MTLPLVKFRRDPLVPIRKTGYLGFLNVSSHRVERPGTHKAPTIKKKAAIIAILKIEVFKKDFTVEDSTLNS
jgi:hypothetical protein